MIGIWYTGGGKQSKAFIQSWWKDYEFYMQAKAKRGHHYQTSCTRNVKGISLSEKEKATNRNMKIMKGKSSLIKANIR